MLLGCSVPPGMVRRVQSMGAIPGGEEYHHLHTEARRGGQLSAVLCSSCHGKGHRQRRSLWGMAACFSVPGREGEKKARVLTPVCDTLALLSSEESPTCSGSAGELG